MATSVLSVILLALVASLSKVNGFGYGQQNTHTITRTVTVTHTLRLTSTRDVKVTETTVVDVPATRYVTINDFVPEDPQTVTSVVRVTSTPVEVKTAVVGVNPARTLLSTYTSFTTTVVTVQLYHTIAHYNTLHQVDTVPVMITKNLQQDVIITSTEEITVTSTVTTGGYY